MSTLYIILYNYSQAKLLHVLKLLSVLPQFLKEQKEQNCMNVQVQFLSFLKKIYSDVVNLPEQEINQIIKISKYTKRRISSYFSFVPRCEAFPNLLLSVSGYNSLDTAKAQGALITEAHNKCFADTCNREVYECLRQKDLNTRGAQLMEQDVILDFFILSLFECTGIYPRINRTTKPYQHRQKLFIKPKNMNIEVIIYVCLK